MSGHIDSGRIASDRTGSDRIDSIEELRWIVPDWPAPANVRAASSLRCGGASMGDYAALNLADHVADDPVAVTANRERLQKALALPAPPIWLTQIHGVGCVDAASSTIGIEADASFTTQAGVVSAVLTADCLPVLLCDKQGLTVASVHAGWRGLAGGVIESTIAAMGEPQGLMAWLGPAIGPQQFEVGTEVRAAFVARDAATADAFISVRDGHWHADLYQLAALILKKQGVSAIYGAEWCTVSSPENFYSYRRDGVTGRMATLIWMTD
ncbi:FIG00003370: Multicopper polyphenol oxidase [hydrothermal vent metagenome]|uniref:FIG00003370: Multicopper polyphenol oxidase n=1 Tax=hydrothermal vent metagenome TaxID=652676 RepID=A0A3B1A680_9ZZZZ